jgi:hypothetical protein|tara:strand:+ start:152 stop:1246 length:1095 start_codon:yes stop_codon:yes gene_type:complete
MDTRLSQIWFNIQENLFPYMEEEIGPLTPKLLQVIQILELVRVEEYVNQHAGYVGRPRKHRQSIARAFVAKAILNLPTTKMLIERLQIDKSLRRICGFESIRELPDESTFSRAFKEFSDQGLASFVHESLIRATKSAQLIGHVSRDSTEIKAREKPLSKKTLKTKKAPQKRGRPKKGEIRSKKGPTVLEQQQSMSYDELMNSFKTGCDVGCKRNSKGNTEVWIGYKFHLDVIDGDIPVSSLLSSASVHDSQVAIPLAEITSRRITNCYDLMDAAYDSPIIRNHSRSLEHVDIIDHNPRRGVKIQFDPAKKVRYNQRSSVERVNGHLKDNFGGRYVRVRGPAKVFTHLMFGVLALTADQLLRLVS